MNQNLIAITGIAQVGKDDLADALTRHGWIKLPFSGVIKEFFNFYLVGVESCEDIIANIREVNPRVNKGKLQAFEDDVLIPYIDAFNSLSAFTENRYEKKIIRPVLEYGGDLIYDHAYDVYFADLDRRLAAGERIVNSRVARLKEAQGFVERGAPLVLVDRPGWPAASEWEAKVMRELQASELISLHLTNDGTHKQWLETCEAFAQLMEES